MPAVHRGTNNVWYLCYAMSDDRWCDAAIGWASTVKFSYAYPDI